MAAIRTAIDGAMRYLSEHPDEAAYVDSPAAARLEDGLRVVTTGPAGESVATDMVPAVGGAGSAPSPGWLLRAAAASCVATLVAMRAAMRDLRLTRLEVVVDSRSDDRGILGMSATVPAGPISARVGVVVAAEGASAADLEELVSWAVDHCPVVDAICRAVPLTVERS